MNDTTVFQADKPGSDQQQAQNKPVVPQANVQHPAASPPVVPPPPVSPPSNLPPIHSHPLLPKLLYGVGGLVGLLLLSFFVWKVVFPFFQPKAPENVELVYWGLWEDEGVMQEVLADFHKQHPTIIVKYSKESIKQYKNKLQTRVLQTGKDAPDIFRFHNSWTPTIKNILLPLPNDVITKEEFAKIYYPVAKNDLIIDGVLYGIPLHIDTLGLFVNSDIINAAGIQAPKTWEEYLQAARQMTVKENGKIKTAGGALGTYDNITHAADILALLFAQNGANSLDLAATSKNAAEVLDFYTFFAKDSENVWDTTLDPSLLAFAKGSLAMYIGYSWDIVQIQAKMRQSANQSMKFEIHPVPYPSTGSPKTLASYWVEGISTKSKHPKEAMLFLKYMLQKEVAQKLFTRQSKVDPTLRPFGELYSRVDLADILKNNQLAYPFISQAKDATSSFFVSDTYDDGFNNKLNQYLANAVNSVLDSTSSPTAIEVLANGVAQVMDEAGIHGEN